MKAKITIIRNPILGEALILPLVMPWAGRIMATAKMKKINDPEQNKPGTFPPI